MLKLFENEYYLAEYDASRDVVIIRRSALQLPTPEIGAAVVARVLDATQLYAGRPLLLDLRLVRGNNDPRFEEALRPKLLRMRRLFPLMARVTQTASGRLQIQRMARERGDGATSGIFTDEGDAFAFLEAHREAGPGAQREAQRSRPPATPKKPRG